MKTPLESGHLSAGSSSVGDRPTSKRDGDRLLLHNFIVVSSTVAAGLLGVAFQATVAHRVAPADYGGIFAVLSLVTLIGLPSGALTLLMARESSRDRAGQDSSASAALLQGGNRALLAAGGGLAILLALASPTLSTFLQLSSQLVIAAAAGLPFGLASPLVLGELQGEQRFLTLATLLTGQAALKLVSAIFLGSLFGAVGIIAGVSLATSIIYLIALRVVAHKFSVRTSRPWFRPAAKYALVLVPSSLAVGVLLNADVLLVKHFFSTRDAGHYSAMVALGRAIFYGASGVAAVLFPKVVFRETRGGNGLRLVILSGMLVVAGGAGALVVFSLIAQPLLSLFAGNEYSASASYLPWYAVAMTLLGVASILIATYQSRATRAFLLVLLPIALIEPALIVLFHHDLFQVIAVETMSFVFLVCGLSALLLSDGRIQAPRRIGGQSLIEGTDSASTAFLPDNSAPSERALDEYRARP